MTTVETSRTDSQVGGLLGKPTSDLLLKVARGTGRSVDLVKIGPQKCTVGAALNSGLRIDEPGVGGIECLILRGEARKEG